MAALPLLSTVMLLLRTASAYWKYPRLIVRLGDRVCCCCVGSDRAAGVREVQALGLVRSVDVVHNQRIAERRARPPGQP